MGRQPILIDRLAILLSTAELKKCCCLLLLRRVGEEMEPRLPAVAGRLILTACETPVAIAEVIGKGMK